MKAAAVFLLLNFIKPIFSAFSSTISDIDQFRNEVDDDISLKIEGIAEIASDPLPPSNFFKLDEIILIQVLSFVEEPFSISTACKWFWKVYSALSSYRIFNGNHLVVPEQFNLLAEDDISISVPILIKAFGNRDKIIDPEFFAKNLELALCSPAIRVAFNFNLWKYVSKTSKFKELTESMFMYFHDKKNEIECPKLESHRRALLYILASLPKTLKIIENFFMEYPVNFLKNSTEDCFKKLSNLISERVALLPIEFINRKNILLFFSFDERILRNLVKIYFQTSNHLALKLLLETNLPDRFKVSDKSYIGCVSILEFVYFAEKYLNRLDSEIIEIILIIEKEKPEHFSPFLARCAGITDPHNILNLSKLFHVSVLNQFWSILDEIQDFSFSYDKNDSEFFNFLIENDPNLISFLISRFPNIVSHRSFLLNAKYQFLHFGTLTNLKEVRDDLKRTIQCPEITRIHILFIQNFQAHLFNLLLADAAKRISKYFALNLKEHERNRYKKHPSFNIALTILDIYYETRLQRRSEAPELDPETILSEMFIELGFFRENPVEFLELAHYIPSFSKALLAGGQEEEVTLFTPEAALTQNFDEFEMLSRTIALNRVIYDGTFINYRLVLKWFEQFGTKLAGMVIPIHELKALLKGAAFQTIRTTDNKKLRFDLDNHSRDEPFNMTYRYAVIVLVTQCKGIKAAVIKRLKNLFPGIQLDYLDNLIISGCDFYRQHSAFFSHFNFVATNSRSERFLIDFFRHFIHVNELHSSEIETIVAKLFAFINLDPFNEILLRDHFIYFIILASFRIQ